MQLAKATLGGLPLLGSSPSQWTLRAGIDPVIESFDLIPSDAEKLFNSTTPVDLVLEKLTIKNLWVIGEAAGENQYIRKVLVADRRWFWSYSHVYRRFNMRRRTGIQRLTGINAAMETIPLDDITAFHQWSVFTASPGPGQPCVKWTAKQALDNVLQSVLDNDMVPGPAPVNRLPGGIEQLPLEDVIIDDDGGTAIDKMLGYIPGAKIWVTADGGIVIDSELQVNAENEKVLPEIVGGGHIIRPSKAIQRPRRINVVFTKEIEVRFDFKEDATIAGGMTRVLTPDARTTSNVLPSPDYSLPVNGKTMCEGTWIPLTQAMDAWGNVTTEFGKLDYDFLMEAMIPFNNLFILLTGITDRNATADWASRLSALQQHFRQTYQINENWMSKISDIKAHRVATINPTTGMRAPAAMYCDYITLASHRLIMSLTADSNSDELPYVRSFATYPADVAGKPGPISTVQPYTKPAPAVVTIVDSDQGIIRADFISDPLKLAELVIPGSMIIGTDGRNTSPIANIDYRGSSYRALTFDSIKKSYERDDVPRLNGEYKCSFIVTVVPAVGPNGTNDNNQLFQVQIDPGDVSSIMNPGKCLGPEMTLRIPPSIETARFAWDDGLAENIEANFGIGDADPTAMDSLCVNYKENDRGASIFNIAQAAAARIWASMADIPIGGATGAMNTAVQPAGFIQNVTHNITGTGEMITHIICPDKLKQVSMFKYLDPGTRAIVLREVPKGA